MRNREEHEERYRAPTPMHEGADPGDRKTGHIVVADDDQSITRLLTTCFEANSIPSSAVFNRYELNRYLSTAHPSLIILDSELDSNHGLNLIREIRSYLDVPIIIMSAVRIDEIDRVVGLELGADDYIAKPFSVRELLARARAILRRREVGRVGREQERGGYRFGGWRLERSSRRLVDPRGSSVPLSNNEHALLTAFLEAPRRPLARARLLQATRIHQDIYDRSVDVQVLRLRRKLEIDPQAPRIILTERGVGYVFALPVETY
jgi:two-component system OmpR family response regulator